MNISTDGTYYNSNDSSNNESNNNTSLNFMELINRDK